MFPSIGRHRPRTSKSHDRSSPVYMSVKRGPALKLKKELFRADVRREEWRRIGHIKQEAKVRLHEQAIKKHEPPRILKGRYKSYNGHNIASNNHNDEVFKILNHTLFYPPDYGIQTELLDKTQSDFEYVEGPKKHRIRDVIRSRINIQGGRMIPNTDRTHYHNHRRKIKNKIGHKEYNDTDNNRYDNRLTGSFISQKRLQHNSNNQHDNQKHKIFSRKMYDTETEVTEDIDLRPKYRLSNNNNQNNNQNDNQNKLNVNIEESLAKLEELMIRNS